jgi:GntR family transcriptional regulator, carbon starvation induced regulator
MKGIHHATLSEQVMHALQHDIITQHFKAGEKLPVGILQKRYACGATPVREALSRLSSDALVEVLQQRGFRVRPIDADDARDLCESLASITAVLVEQALGNMTPALLASCVAVWQQVQKGQAVHPLHWQSVLRHVHVCFLEHASSAVLKKVEAQLYRQITRYQHALIPEASLPFLPKMHALHALMEALHAQDSLKVNAYFTQHYQQQARHLVRRCKECEKNREAHKEEA